MTPRRRSARALAGLLAALTAVACGGCVVVLLLGDPVVASRREVAVAAWACGVAAVLLAVAAVQEHANPDDDPRYLETIVHGFVDEWRR
ncbi:hypothetical protein BH20ACT6_BH20ACT6_03220 [soil metagenome]